MLEPIFVEIHPCIKRSYFLQSQVFLSLIKVLFSFLKKRGHPDMTFLSYLENPLIDHSLPQFALSEADGSPLYGFQRQVTISRTEKTSSGNGNAQPTKHIVRDDGIVQYDFVAEPDATMITILVRKTCPMYKYA